MKITRAVVTGVLCAIAAGCGAANPANQLSPSSVTPVALPVTGGTTPQLSALSIGSCPDGNAPSWLQTWTKGTSARLRWTEVAPTIDYHVVVERYDVTNQYVLVDSGNLFVANQTWTELTLPEGRYRARIQTRSCGRYMGPWSDELQFSVEGDETSSNEVQPSGESAEGTKVFPGQSLTDSFGVVWSLGAPAGSGTYEILRDGVNQDQGTFAKELKYHNHTVYLFAADGNWYQYIGSGNWSNVGPTEP